MKIQKSGSWKANSREMTKKNENTMYKDTQRINGNKYWMMKHFGASKGGKSLTLLEGNTRR